MSTETHGAAHTPESTPSAVPPKAASAALDTVKAASQDALAAFKLFASNPVGGLPPAYDTLGEAKALRVGIAFGVVSVLCFLLGGYLLFPFKDGLFDHLGFSGVLKAILFAVMPFVCTVGGTIGVRKVFGGQGSLASDCFIPGAALLPMSLWMLISGILGYSNYTVIAALTVFAGTTGLLMLFSGYTRTMKLTDRAATIAIPIVILLTVGITQMLARSVIGGAIGGGDFRMPSNFGF